MTKRTDATTHVWDRCHDLASWSFTIVAKRTVAGERCHELVSLVSTQVGRCVLVPEGRRILAGGGTTGTASAQSPSPERATDQARSTAPAGAGEVFSDCFRWFYPLASTQVFRRCSSRLCRLMCGRFSTSRSRFLQFSSGLCPPSHD